MVMTSQQIAAQVGAFQQSSMMQMQHAGMLSQFAGGMRGDAQFQAGNFMGSAMNTAGAIGQPMVQGGMMLAGMDPVSMGLRAGAWGLRTGGVMGAGAAGLAGAAGVGIPLMAAQYAGTQMWQGARQQQQLNTQLNSTFRFANQYGGRGFASGELGGIGQMMRGMTSQRGPGGEFTTMDELGRLAANMGRMGMAQGVRNAKDFRDKFQKMMKTVKEVATQLSTSLEEAQKTMASMKGSGIFGRGFQTQAAGMVRQGMVAGGRTAGEMSQIANIGSQMARQVGGRGRAGAVAGMEALTRVGAAVKAGVLSEEDIYNQTGQTGAAGQQAMAAGMVQGDLEFFKSGLGRRALAAMAGKNGQLDLDSMKRMMSGEVGTGETMQMAYANLGKVGRANFIRNEGRLRGEAAAAMGGLGKAMVARGWLKQRGMNLDKMDDRQMLFFQRKFKLDRDQADNLIKMARDLPRIMEGREQSMEEDKFMRDVEQSNRYRGLEGVKRQLEDAKKKVNDKLQQVGANFYQDGANLVEGFINRLTGRFVDTVDRDLTKTVHQVMKGGAYGEHLAATRLGIKGIPGQEGLALLDSQMSQQAAAGIFGTGGGGGAGFQRRFARLNERQFKEAGWNIVNNADLNRERQRAPGGTYRLGYAKAGVHERLNRIQRITSAVNETDDAAFAMGQNMRDEVRMSTVFRNGTGRGQDALTNFGKELDRMAAGGSREALQLRERYAQADDEERARIMGSVRAGAGRSRGGYSMTAPKALGLFEQGRFATVQDRQRAIGAYALGGGGRADYFQAQQRLGQNAGTAAGALAGGMIGTAILPGVGTVVGAIAGGIAGNYIGGSAANALTGANRTPEMNKRIQASYGQVMDSENGRRMMEMVLSKDSRTREAAMNSIAARQEVLEERYGGDAAKMSEAERGEYEANKSFMAAASVTSLAEKHGGDPNKITDEEWKRLEMQTGESRDQLARRVGSVGATMDDKQRKAMEQYGRRAGEISRNRRRRQSERGLTKGGALTEKATAGLEGIGAGGMTEAMRKELGLAEGAIYKYGPGGKQVKSLGEMALQSLVSADERRAQMTGTNVDSDMALESAALGDLRDFDKMYRSMSTKDRQAFQQQLRDKGFQEKAQELQQRDETAADLKKGFSKELERKKGGGFKAGQRFTRESFYSSVGKQLGVDLKYKPGQKDKNAAAMQEDLVAQLTQGVDAGTLKDLGVDMASLDKMTRQLEKARQTGDIEGAAGIVENIKGMGIKGAAEQAKQDATAKMNDPSYRALVDIKTALSETLKVNVQNTVKTEESSGDAKQQPGSH